MKTLRVVLSVALILFALWVIVGEQMTGASANAVVNAPVVTVRAPTAGNLSLSERPFGARIQEGEVIASIDDTLVDTIRLNDLRMEREFALAEVTRIEADLESTRAMRDSLMQRANTFRENRLSELRTRLSHARRRLAILEGGEMPADTDQRLIDLVDDMQARLPQEPYVAPLVLDHARERVAVLEIALRAAEAGVFLGDGYNDSPNAEQRATELESVISGLESRLAEARARHASLDQRTSRERLRVNGLAGGDIVAPVNGRYWETLQSDGVAVQRGDPILRLLDCEGIVVTLSVTEMVYNDLRIGQAATFRLSGGDTVHEARVGRLAGTGAERIYRNLAVAPTQKHLERYDVTLQVPGLASDPARGCAVGQTGRAFFDTRPLDWLRGLLP
ncbi:HlyD family secretion protein [Salipiger mucosus]|uniref:HlyD family secretion protein n=1 Tax=Salipiger mucosus DSM 16094 TaxID=1123237 RepID=S9Q5I0_9RHOB|nr:HlyD family efflux transporter periplasmic adaptor subunit [Salipiger mucosus]EPX76586.1 hypothetical protein Salmuc_00418 [Salipiger mucosus DSM 16094]